MAEENDKLLTEEELAAIEEMVAAGDLGGEGYNVGVASSNYDITRQDTSVGVNVTAIEQINDRLHRFMRIGLLDELRYNARLQPARTEIIRYADYVSGPLHPWPSTYQNRSAARRMPRRDSLAGGLQLSR